MGMTRADKFEEIFGYRPATDQVLCNEHDLCGENNACNYCMSNPNNIGREEDWWNAEYKEPTTKNDLGVDCIVDILGSYTDLDIPYKREIAEDILTKLSLITPQEPKTGHWIEKAEDYYKAINEYGGGVDENTDYFTDDIACPKCLSKFSTIDNETERFRHCPNCGCRMVEPQESETNNGTQS